MRRYLLLAVLGLSTVACRENVFVNDPLTDPPTNLTLHR